MRLKTPGFAFDRVMWRKLADGLPMAELGESNHHHLHHDLHHHHGGLHHGGPEHHSGLGLGPGPHGRKDSACDNDLWPPDAPDAQPLPPPPRPFLRMGSTMTGSEASLPGPRRKEQRRQEFFNSEILNAVLNGDSIDKVSKLLEDGAEANAVCSPTRTSALHLCALRPGARAEAVAVAALLLDHGADMRHRDHCDRTALHLAAWAGAADLLELLLRRYQAEKQSGESNFLGIQTRAARDHGEREPFPSTWNDSWNHAHSAVEVLLPCLESGSTALHVACQRVHLRCISLLTGAGADRSVLDDRGFTPIDVLHEFPGYGEEDGLGEEEDRDADAALGAADTAAAAAAAAPPDADQPPLPAEVGGGGSPPGPPSASFFRTEVVLGPGAAPPFYPLPAADAKPKARLPAAAPAAPARDTSDDTRLLEAIKLLKKEGGGNFMTGSALHTAVTTGCLKVVENLLNVDPSSACAINAKGETPVHAAIEARSIEALRLLMKANEPAINVPNSAGATPLMMAVVNEWNEGVSELLLANADVAARDLRGATVLHEAAAHADSQLLRELLSIEEAVQVLDAEREDGLTPLFVAVESSSLERVQRFMEAGARLTHTLPDGVNIVHRAVQLYNSTNLAEHEEMVRLLADRLGSSVSVEERSLLDALQSGAQDPGLAPVHMAAKNGHDLLVDVLLRNGSNPRVRTVREAPLYAATALHLAAQYGHINVVELLVRAARTARLLTLLLLALQNVVELLVRAARTARLLTLLLLALQNVVELLVRAARTARLLTLLLLALQNVVELLVRAARTARLLTLLLLALQNVVELLVRAARTARLLTLLLLALQNVVELLVRAARTARLLTLLLLALQNVVELLVRAARTARLLTLLLLALQNVVELLVRADRKLLSTKDGREWRPIHMAAHFAQREVLRFMIKQGADLATGVRDDQNRSCSALSLLVHSVAKPVDFLEELLDESIALNDYPVSDHRAQIDVRYDILIPVQYRGCVVFRDVGSSTRA
ncbi:Ankyrin repeat and SOCS box protein 2 [Frankliniella fusca]|uniref:Ankyrin repeat and SOCS box protein 2 n=1 Tax=Frankliniella fusca TaxID=407009 RepID=A0AAE1I3I9_9NEOP|nr:Ankyrin repeat and SOCS box protein 2 [Frankliniella fusca]